MPTEKDTLQKLVETQNKQGTLSPESIERMRKTAEAAAAESKRLRSEKAVSGRKG